MAGKTGILFLILIFVNTRWLAIAALPPKETQKEVAIVEGYRSAKFGMTESEIYSAIEKDFDVNRRSVKKIENQFDKTTNLAVTVPKLLEEAGQARLFYILGYQNKKLIQINIIWGNPFDPNPNPQEILNAANVLRNYFLRKGFKQDDLLLNARWAFVFVRGMRAFGAVLPEGPCVHLAVGMNDRQVRLTPLSLPLSGTPCRRF